MSSARDRLLQAIRTRSQTFPFLLTVMLPRTRNSRFLQERTLQDGLIGSEVRLDLGARSFLIPTTLIRLKSCLLPSDSLSRSCPQRDQMTARLRRAASIRRAA